MTDVNKILHFGSESSPVGYAGSGCGLKSAPGAFIKHKMESEIKEAFKFLNQHVNCLSQGQSELLKGLQKYYRENKELTEKQMKVLFEIKKYVNDVSKKEEQNNSKGNN